MPFIEHVPSIQQAEIVHSLGEGNHWTIQMPEPDTNELARVQVDKLRKNSAALQFAYRLEWLDGNEPNEYLTAPVFAP
ncbi:hypothetical protein MUP56_00125, partial [Patescibacteria group bacterium]|nr:hypothetical protein [Patescibacteria group bacterium]